MAPSAYLTSPATLVTMMPWALLFAWVARRLLGARRVMMRTTLLAGIGGYLAGLAMAWAVVGTPDEPGSGAFLLTATVPALGFVMVGIVALALAASRPDGPRLTVSPPVPRLPHPLRVARQRIGNARRSVKVSRDHHHPRPGRCPGAGPAGVRRRYVGRRADQRPTVTATLTLLDLLGYAGLVAGGVPGLRVILAVVQDRGP